MDKELYKTLMKRLDNVEEVKQKYHDLYKETINSIAEILDVPAFTISLEIIPPFEDGEQVDYVHKLTVSTVQLPVNLTLKSINKLQDFVESQDMELHPKRDKLVFTYTQDYEWVSYTELSHAEDSEYDYDPLNDEDQLLL